MLYHAHSPDEVIAELHSSKHGLHQIYAEGRVKRYGRNNIRLSRRSLLTRTLMPLTHIFSLAILAAVLASLLVGNYTVSGVLLGTLAVYIAMRYLQDFSLEHTKRHIEQRATAKTTVLRDSITASIDAALVVPGDIVVVGKGDSIPADGRVIHSRALHINQIYLTGSSLPVPKYAKTLHSDTPLEEQSNMVFRGSYVTSGDAQFVVTATGNHTQYGQLHSSLIKAETTGRLQQKINHLLTRILLFALGAAFVVALLSMARGITADIALQYCVAILIAAIPQSLPVAIGIIVALGMRQMAKHAILASSIHAIEATSIASALASDKTGMLTHDMLAIKEIWQPNASTLTPAVMCDKAAIRRSGDSHDSALAAHLKQLKHTPSTHIPAASFGFSREVGMSGNLWHNGKSYTLHIKGTPEKILNRSLLTSAEYEAAEQQLHQLAGKGYHILALAHTTLSSPISKLTSLPKRQPLQFDGFIALQDHVRPDVQSSIVRATEAGIATHVVTGDHVETAYQLGKRLGLISTRSQVFDSRKLDVINDSQLARICRDVAVFARVSPSHKQRILNALKRRHITMMTGDSVDDVPVLLGAQVGIASSRGSRIAQEASDILLLNDKFSTILEAVKYSRTILGNIRRMVFYSTIVAIAELSIVIGSLLASPQIILLPEQLLWLNLVVATCVLLPLGLEPHSRNIMTRKPVSPRAPILPKYLVVRAALLSITLAGVAILVFKTVYPLTSLEYARSLTFATVIVMLLVTALIARSDHTSTLVRFRTWSPLIYGSVIFLAICHILLFISPLHEVFGLAQLAPNDIVPAMLIAIIAPLGVAELHKLYSRHAVRKKGRSY